MEELLAMSQGNDGPLGYAVVGCGRISHMHLKAAKSLPDDLAVVAVVDTIEEKAREVASEFDVSTVYSSLDSALADDRIAIIDICTQPVHHVTLGVQALNAGRHVVIEKPLCLTVGEADALISAAKQNGVTAMSGQSRRFNEPVFAAKRLIDEGTLGRLLHIQAAAGDRTEGPPIAWWGDAAVTGASALLANWASHWLDQILYLAGKRPLRVYAEAADHHDKYAGFDEWSMLIRFEDDLIAAYTHSFNCRMGVAGGFEYAGTKATLDIRVNRLFLEGEEVKGVGHNINDFAGMLAERVASIREGRKPLCDAEQVRDVVAVSEAALISAQEGRVVTLSEVGVSV
jgi:predicted dehydrogenase